MSKSSNPVRTRRRSTPAAKPRRPRRPRGSSVEVDLRELLWITLTVLYILIAWRSLARGDQAPIPPLDAWPPHSTHTPPTPTAGVQ